LDALLEVIGAIGSVIHEAEHSRSDGDGGIRCAETCSMGFPCMAIKKSTQCEQPVDWQISTAWSSAAHFNQKICSAHLLHDPFAHTSLASLTHSKKAQNQATTALSFAAAAPNTNKIFPKNAQISPVVVGCHGLF